MNAGAIRDRLYDYIRVADDKKIKAIYMMLEDDISEETEWWNNPAFVSELEKEYQAWDSGKDKGYSLADIKAEIASRKAKKHHIQDTKTEKNHCNKLYFPHQQKSQEKIYWREIKYKFVLILHSSRNY